MLFNVWIIVAKPTVLIFQNRRCFFSFVINYEALALEVGSSWILHSHCSLFHFFKLYENVSLSATFVVSRLVDVNNVAILPLKKSMEILNICPLSIKSWYENWVRDNLLRLTQILFFFQQLLSQLIFEHHASYERVRIFLKHWLKNWICLHTLYLIVELCANLDSFDIRHGAFFRLFIAA